jgi:acetyl-CoA carboxylase biotin carboxyl carrier protein
VFPDAGTPVAEPPQPWGGVRQRGQHVAPNDILALVQVGPLYLPVRSPVAGTLKSLVATAGSRLEYGSEIALLLPTDAASAKL